MAISSKQTSGPRRRESVLAHNFRVARHSGSMGSTVLTSIPSVVGRLSTSRETEATSCYPTVLFLHRERTDLPGRVFHFQIERSSQRSPLTETTFPLEEKSATWQFREVGKIKSAIAIVPFCA